MSRTMQMPPPPPLLLTKRVTSFLRANLSPQINTAMLTSPAGSLLAHASNLPASALRRQAAVAASLWALQGPAHTAPTSAGPAPATITAGSTVRSRKSGKHSQPTVTVQLDSGAVFVIRRLRCGMLFICMGGTEGAGGGGGSLTPAAPHPSRLPRSPGQTTTTANPTTTHSQDETTPTSTAEHPATDLPIRARPTTPPPRQPIPATTTPPTTAVGGGPPTLHPGPSTATTAAAAGGGGGPAGSTPTPGSPSEAASILSNNTTHTTGGASTTSTATLSGSSSVSLMRRQVEELARWLDERLSGLSVPEEGIGIGLGSGVGTGNGAAVAGGSGSLGGGGAGLEVR